MSEILEYPVLSPYTVQYINIFCTFDHLDLCLFKLFYWSFPWNCDRLGINFQLKSQKTLWTYCHIFVAV
jgi:hypothetical protein